MSDDGSRRTPAKKQKKHKYTQIERTKYYVLYSDLQ